jgi:hypothetical protein
MIVLLYKRNYTYWRLQSWDLEGMHCLLSIPSLFLQPASSPFIPQVKIKTYLTVIVAAVGQDRDEWRAAELNPQRKTRRGRPDQ